MDLISVIGNAGAGLGLYQIKVATASNNIANSNTPGYARQSAIATETIPEEEAGRAGYIGRGVSLEAIVQSRDKFIESQLNSAFANSASSSAESDALGTVMALDPGAEGGISDAIGAFYSSLRDLNQNPSDLSLRQAVIYSSQSLATSFNRTAISISAARTGIDENVTALVDKVNSLSAGIADLNGKIALAVNSGRTPNDMLDVRQNQMDQLAQLIGARPVPDTHSNYSMVLPGGTCLVSGISAATLKVQASSTNNGHLDVMFEPTDGSGAVVLKTSELGGQIGGLLNARDVVLGAAEADVNALAYDFIGAVNAQSQLGYALDHTNGHDLFQSLASSNNAATLMAVDSSAAADPRLIAAAGSATSGPGDGDNLQALIATEGTALTNGLNVKDGMAKLTSDFGIATSKVSDASQFDKRLLEDLQNARQSTSGVSVDDEMTTLLQAQNAYNGLVKVVATANTMLDKLMEMV
jgi:flagellar hook-associated protein 1 FlgK